MDFFYRLRNPLALALLLLVQTLGLAIQVRHGAETGEADAAGTRVARSWVVGAVSPMERVLHGAGLGARSVWGNYLDLRGARRENVALREQLGRLRLEQTAIAEDALEGQRLERVLQFQQSYPGATVAAQVIGTSGSEMSRVLYLDKGAADGLRPDMAVITPDGIVGKVRAVFPTTAPHTAQVLLINDQTSGAGVILEQTRVRAVLRGTTEGELEIGNLTPDDRLKAGDRVVTSGGDGIFPRGLPVGTIASIGPDPRNAPYSVGRVRPSTHLNRLEEVLVMTGTESTLPPATMAALAHGAAVTQQARVAAAKATAERVAAAEAAREEAARSAAEIVADRLPSIHEANAPGSGAGAAAGDAAGPGDAGVGKAKVDPKTAGGTVPPPLPAVHADRYSPGATPPASELQPGAARPEPARPPAPLAAPPQD